MRASLAVLALLCRSAVFAACGDLDAVCAGGDCCAPDCLSFVAAGTVCRAASGVCDVEETCDGTSADCPPDGFAAPATVCRSSAGACDLAESCTGTDAACPPDVKSTAECRSAMGDCDVAETCDGTSDDCPPDGFAASTMICRSSAGACDTAENCTGTDAACPPDAKRTAVCRPAAGDCDVAEVCDGVGDACPPDDFAPPTTPCRSAAGECDVPENCNGSSPDCPPDAKSTSECRPAVGVCDVPEFCDGVGDACPPDGFVSATTPCRPAAGPCDVAENCTGAGPDCPADVKSTSECRPSAGVCDVAEFCDGVGDACPADMKSTAVCRPAVDVCDVAESCDGLNDACPPDVFAPPTLVCRPAVDQCDVAESCSGVGPSCPPDGLQPNGTPCSDDDACTRVDRCSFGVCTGTDPVTCAALDGCHAAGTCDPATGTCSNPTKPDNVSCNDGNPCTTADSCQAGVCTGLHIAGCCRLDAECDDGLACTDDRCVGTACTHAPIDERCGAAAECHALVCLPSDPAADASGCVARPTDEGSYCSEDGDPCTIDACRSGECLHQSDNSGPRCVVLVAPYRTAVGLLARTRDLEATLRAATATVCTRLGAGCDVAAGPDTDRLVALLASTEGDVGTAALALAGRLADSSPSAPRDPDTRLRLAIGFISGVPGELRGFLATLAQARARHTVDPAYARARRAEGRRLLTGAGKLRRQLVRAATRHQTFAR